MSHAPTGALARRHQALRTDLAARRLDALIVTALPNVLYLTNFTGSAGIVVVTPDGLRFLTDSRYVTAITDSQSGSCACPALELALVDGSYDATLTSIIASMSHARVGFEAAHVTVSRHKRLTAALERAGSATELVPTEGLIEGLRAIKDEHEIATLREAGRRLSRVAATVIGQEVRRGRTERDVALAIDWHIRQAGFSKAAFETIVAAGPNSALPHARPGERKLTEGDLVVLDFGGVYDSYCVDLTRTVSAGAAAGRVREVYGAVLAAHDDAIAAVVLGRSRFAVDAAARDTLTRRGLGDAFGHGTGHGLGIEVHEDPRISRRRQETDEGVADEFLAAGMVFTIEPGAYLPGWGGVRIEDDVLVTRDGVEVLTDVTTELIEI
jgi:Xaa-Pro aminopeptidase